MKEFMIALARRLNVIPVPFVDIHPRIALARIIMEANQFGVYEALEKSPSGLTREELCQATELSEKGARVLLDALAASGYLKSANGRYTNGRWVKKWIVSPETGMPNLLKLQMNMWDRLTDLNTPLRTGKPARDHHLEVIEHTEKQDIYTRAMREACRVVIPGFKKHFKVPPGATRLLDLGGAHGDMARAAVERFPFLKATVMDLPGPLQTAKEVHASEGNPLGIELKPGNALTDDIGSGWDVVLLCQFIHCFDDEQVQGVLDRVYEALSPGGVVVILDQYQGLGVIQNGFSSLMSLAYFTLGGRCYEVKDVEKMLRQSGYARTVTKPFPRKSPTAIIEGWKA